MGVFSRFPYSNAHQLNLDWVLSEMKAFEEEIEKLKTLSQIKYADPLQWSIDRNYEENTVTVYNNIAYLSKAPVPAGIDITNTDYWVTVFDLTELFLYLKSGIAEINNGTTATKAYAEYTLVWVADTLYYTLRDISTGDAFIEGSNVEKINVSDFVYKIYRMALEDIAAERDARIAADSALENLINSKTVSYLLNVKDFGAVGDGVTDDIDAFDAALVAAKNNGGFIIIPKGIYMLSRPWVIGDGSASAESTYHDITIIGEGMGANKYMTYAVKGKTILRRMGNNNGAMIRISGPIINVHITNIELDCNEVAAYGIEAIHAAYSTFTKINVVKHTNIAYYSTTVNGNPVVYGAAGNKWDLIQCDDGSNGSQTAMKLTGSLGSGNTYKLDTCRNVISRCELVYGINGRGVELEMADNNIFQEGQIYTPPETPNGTSVYLNRPANYPNFPSENAFYNLAIVKGVGGQAGQLNANGAGGHWFLPYPGADGEPVPNIENTHVLTYDGKEYFNGNIITKMTNTRVENLTTKNLSTTDETVTEFTVGRSDDDTPLSLVVEGSLSINGTAQIQVQVDGVLMSGGYRYLTGAAYGTLSFECYQYLGAGAHTVRILASTTSGNTGTVNGGFINSYTIV